MPAQNTHPEKVMYYIPNQKRHMNMTKPDTWAVYPIAGIYLSEKLCIHAEFSPITITASDLCGEFVFSILIILDSTVWEALVLTVVILWPMLCF